MLGFPPFANCSIARALMFKKWPEVDRNMCVVVSCGHPRCVALEHIQRGVINYPMTKLSPL
jgi:hypothetical protein